jgi:hypothetical protein
MAGLAINLVQVYRTGRALHWEFLRLRTGHEGPALSSPAHASISLAMRQIEIEVV